MKVGSRHRHRLWPEPPGDPGCRDAASVAAPQELCFHQRARAEHANLPPGLRDAVDDGATMDAAIANE
jgi:hypothetical protein